MNEQQLSVYVDDDESMMTEELEDGDKDGQEEYSEHAPHPIINNQGYNKHMNNIATRKNSYKYGNGENRRLEKE